MKKLFYIALLFISPEIFATIFTPVPGDESLNLLALILGPSVGSISLDSTGNIALNQAIIDVMTQLNVVVVALGAIIVSYVGIMSTIHTAHEGTVMGKKWSAVWVPMRSVAGMALLIPGSGTGYSMIQVSVMYIVLNGVGAADFMWNLILDDLKNGINIVNPAQAGNPSTNTDFPDPKKPSATQFIGDATATTPSLGQNLLDAQICMQVLKNMVSNKDETNLIKYAGNIRAYMTGPPTVSYCHDKTCDASPSNVLPFVNKVTVSSTMNFGVSNNNLGAAVCGSLNFTGTAYCTDLTSAGDCGSTQTASTPSTNTLLTGANNIYAAKVSAVNTLMQTMNTQLLPQIISTATAAPYSYGKTISKGTFAPVITSGVTKVLGNKYVGLMSVTVPTSSTQGTATMQNSFNDAVNSGKLNGWVSAGSFYYVFSQTKSQPAWSDLGNPPQANNIPSCTNPKTGTSCAQGIIAGTASSPLKGLGNINNIPNDNAMLKTLNGLVSQQETIDTLSLALANADKYWNTDNGTASAAGGSLNIQYASTMPSAFAALLMPISVIGNSIVQGLITGISNSNSDPLIAHSIFGQALMATCEFIWVGIIAALFGTSLVTGMFGFGVPFFELMLTLGVMVFGFLGSMWAFGATLALYCPFIPFMIYTMGVIGWMITVTEAIFGAPLVALSLVMPSQDELGEIKAALMILANIFLRPTLMVIGFAFAGKLYKAAVTLLNFGFGPTLQAINIGTLFSPVVILGMYCTFMISLTNNCFALIYILPDKILRWMGSGEQSTDVSNLQEAKRGADSGSKLIGNEMVGAAKAAQQYKKSQAEKSGGGGGGGGGASSGGSAAGGGGTGGP